MKGILCPKSHFNPPRVLFCRMCGVSMAHQRQDLVDGSRLPVGVLVLDDGSLFSVDDDVVLGRQPESDPDVRAGRAQPLVLGEGGSTVAPVHAAIRMEQWDARLVDLGSAHGTAVLVPGARTWRSLGPGDVVTLTGGTSIRLGSRVVSYETLQRI